jgi:hypothetical protein
MTGTHLGADSSFNLALYKACGLADFLAITLTILESHLGAFDPKFHDLNNRMIGVSFCLAFLWCWPVSPSLCRVSHVADRLGRSDLPLVVHPYMSSRSLLRPLLVNYSFHPQCSLDNAPCSLVVQCS